MSLVIGQYIDSFLPALDGVVNVVKNYAQILNGNYGQCYVIAPKVPGYADNESFPVLRFKSAKVSKKRKYRTGFPALDVKYRWHVRSIDFDLVHAHSPFGCGLEARRAATELGIPMVATFHSKYYDDFKQATHSDMIAQRGVKYVAWFYQYADYVWTVNHSTAQTLREYGYKGPIRVVPNGVDAFKPDNAGELIRTARQRYHMSDGCNLLFVGQLILQKNVRLIAEALALLKKTRADFQMLFVGDGPARNELAKYCKKLGLAQNVSFTGAIYDRVLLNSLYLASDLLLLPSLYDNAPLVVREAAAMETPALLVRGSNAAEGVIDGYNGFLCDESAQSMCSAITAALSDRQRLGLVSKTAYETLPIGWQEIVSQVNGYYHEILDDYRFRRNMR